MQAAFKTGMIFTAIGQYSNVAIQLIINVVLSRLIPVQEFGVVATVQVFLTFFQMLVTAGLGPAIIQNKEIKDKDYGILFNYTVILAILLAVFFGIFGQVIAFIYNNEIYKSLFWSMSVIVFSEGINVVPTAILNKQLRFKALNIRLLICNILGAVCGIIAALAGLGVYALVLSVAIPSVTSLIANFLIVKIDYTLKMSAKPLKAVWGFAGNQLGFTILNYFSRNSDNLLIGKLLGPIPLANYQKSYQLITMPNTVFLGVISPVLQPVLSNHQDNVKLIRETFLKIVRVLSLIGFPLTAFMIINSREIILFLFGNRWEGAILPFSILAFSIWAQMLTSATGSIFMARNHSKTLFYTGIISTVLIVSLTVIGTVFDQITFVALFVCVAYLINFVTSYWILMRKVLESNLGELFRILAKPFILGIIVGGIALGIKEVIVIDNVFINLLVNGISWLIALGVCLIISGELKKIKQLFSR
jgi:PST family polysaccharide transporter